MKKLVVLITIFSVIQGYSQGRRGQNGIAQPSREVREKEIEKRQRDMEERKEEYIKTFISTLEADAFQKEIIKQSISSFYDTKLEILKTEYEHRLDRKDALTKLEQTHFKDLENLISEDDMVKIQELVKGNFDEKEVKKKKKKKKKKKN
ncbi:hypothetical protein [Winogradskyella aurantia]|uniref:Uncharacterized protein n=1 Tax=Winogradskyella aurantia TaxID=1915063 RepID=A0A265UTM9_9FLAO|nr:hypothetical protein [Winogradskyella aurantia]OZV68675.1 hypothetical protein CA834_09435 [Winogradskyella aurantia]